MNYINKLTYVSYDGFIEMDSIHNNYDSVLELDCKDITTEDKFWFYFGLYFNFPTRVDNWAAFSDWMRDLAFWDRNKSILIIFKNVDELFCRNLTLQSLAMSVFWEEVLPYWENEVIKVTSGSMQPRQFDVYCVMSQYDDF